MDAQSEEWRRSNWRRRSGRLCRLPESGRPAKVAPTLRWGRPCCSAPKAISVHLSGDARSYTQTAATLLHLFYCSPKNNQKCSQTIDRCFQVCCLLVNKKPIRSAAIRCDPIRSAACDRRHLSRLMNIPPRNCPPVLTANVGRRIESDVCLPAPKNGHLQAQATWPAESELLRGQVGPRRSSAAISSSSLLPVAGCDNGATITTVSDAANSRLIVRLFKLIVAQLRASDRN